MKRIFSAFALAAFSLTATVSAVAAPSDTSAAFDSARLVSDNSVVLGNHSSTPNVVTASACSSYDTIACSYTGTLIDLIDNVPAGTPTDRPKIAISIYSISSHEVVDALLRADVRGDNVEVLTFKAKSARHKKGAAPTGQLKRLLTGLQHSDHSSTKVCSGSCRRSGSVGIMHAKLLALSTSGTDHDIVVTSSGNLSWTTSGQAWNEFQVFSSPAFYQSTVDYIESSFADKNLPDVAPVTDGDITLRFSPYARAHHIDPVYDELRATHGSPGCYVSEEMYAQTHSKDKYARELARIAREGCQVRLIANFNEHYTRSTQRYLKKSHVELYKANRDPQHPHTRIYTHKKKWVFHSYNAQGQVRDVVYTGSTNATVAALNNNQEEMIILRGDQYVLDARAQTDVELPHMTVVKSRA